MLTKSNINRLMEACISQAEVLQNFGIELSSLQVWKLTDRTIKTAPNRSEAPIAKHRLRIMIKSKIRNIRRA